MTFVTSSIVAIVLVADLSLAIGGVEADELRGRIVLEQHCSRCHAIGADGRSQHPSAPPFRILGNSYDMDKFAEVLQAGVLAIDPDMPSISFSREDAEAAAAYLRSIQR